MSLLAGVYRRFADSNNDRPMRGYKVTDANRTRKIGVACRSLRELKQKASTKLNVTDDLEDIGIFLLDGSEIDEEYFATLEPQTTLIFRRPGEEILTEADVLYQMLRRLNENCLRNSDSAEALLTDKLRARIALLNRVLNSDDKKTLCSKKQDHPEWFEGLDSNSSTKEAYLHRRCQDRIRGYLYKAIEQIRGSEVYLENEKARKQLQYVIVYFKSQLKKDHYFGHYFDRSRAVKSEKNDSGQSDDEPDSSENCCYEECPCKMNEFSYEKYILGLEEFDDILKEDEDKEEDDEEEEEEEDDVDAQKFVTPAKRSRLDQDRQNQEREEFLEAEKKCPYEVVTRSKKEMTALCDDRGEFTCCGVWNADKCAYEQDHKINPYRSKEELVLFSTWNLDHKIERSRTLVPQLLEASQKNISDKIVYELYDNLFTSKNLKLVHIVCHDKGSHK